jgi:subtilisin family serine protease
MLLSLTAAALGVFFAQTSSTLCKVEEVSTTTKIIDLRLVGCGEGFSDNVLWHLDRADSVDGSLDGRSTRITTGKGAVVYVCDTGVMRDHDEFARADGSVVIDGILARDLRPSCPASVTNPAIQPCFNSDASLFINTHGTSVASVIAGRNTGVAPDAKIVSVYVGDNGSAVWIDAFDRIIRHAWAPTTPQFKTAIVNMSQVPGFSSDAASFTDIETKMREMVSGVDAEGRPDPHGKRFLFVTVAGNTNARPEVAHCDSSGNSRLYPASLGPMIDGLITVGGMDKDNRFWSGSCKGPVVEILAPADDILVASISNRDHYRSSKPHFNAPPNSGTSYAAPFVAGMAACLLEKDPDMTPAELEMRIKATASHTADAVDAPATGRVAIFEVVPASPKRRAAQHR